MNQKEFLKELKENLIGLPKEDIEEIIGDCREHFRVGKKKNRNEMEIAKSLGNPREIAREARRELKEGSELSLSEELIEFKIKTKKLLKNFWRLIKRKTPKLIKEFKDFFEGFGKVKKRVKKKTKDKNPKNRKWSSLKITLLILLNFFIILWLWIGLFATIVGLIVSSWAVLVSGIVSFMGALFGLAMPFSSSISNLLLSGLFASLGVICLGFIFSILSWKLKEGFFWLTKRYLKWNNKIFGGKNE